jgi:release factor glutamine methyltransferase
MTHNSYIGLDRTQAAAREHGLSCDVCLSILVYVPEEKLALMTPSIVEAEEGRSLHSFGPYTFGEIHIVEFGAPDA